MNGVRSDLVHRQVDASVGDDANHVGNVAPIEGSHALLPEDLLGTVRNARILARRPQRQPGLQHLGHTQTETFFYYSPSSTRHVVGWIVSVW